MDEIVLNLLYLQSTKTNKEPTTWPKPFIREISLFEDNIDAWLYVMGILWSFISKHLLMWKDKYLWDKIYHLWSNILVSIRSQVI